jgi:hypothetical protein
MKINTQPTKRIPSFCKTTLDKLAWYIARNPFPPIDPNSAAAAYTFDQLRAQRHISRDGGRLEFVYTDSNGAQRAGVRIEYDHAYCWIMNRWRGDVAFLKQLGIKATPIAEGDRLRFSLKTKKQFAAFHKMMLTGGCK